MRAPTSRRQPGDRASSLRQRAVRLCGEGVSVEHATWLTAQRKRDTPFSPAAWSASSRWRSRSSPALPSLIGRPDRRHPDVVTPGCASVR